MGDLLTDRALNACRIANQEAHDWGHDWIEPEHLMLGLIKEGSIAKLMLNQICDKADQLQAAIEMTMTRGPHVGAKGKLPLTPNAKRAVELALTERHRFNHKLVGTEHLLLGLLMLPDSRLAGAFKSLDVDLEQIRRRMLTIMAVIAERSL